MSKRVSIVPKPARPGVNEEAKEAWVASRENPPPPKRPTKRLTFDIDAELHQRIRVACARQGVVMADEIRKFLEERFPPERS